MKDLKHVISQAKKQFSEHLKQAKTEQELKCIHTKFLGRKGKLVALMAKLKTLPVDQKRLYGPLLQELRKFYEDQYEKKQAFLTHQLHRKAQQKKRYFDVTAYQTGKPQGSLHVYTKIIQELEDIFISMGYEYADGPELETDYYNFQALNITQDHPARDAHDTFWLNLPSMLLRTHTSTIQIRALEQKGLPLALFAPGRAYRNEATDASHDFMFTQVEGLVIDKEISMANLLGTAQLFLQKVFGKKNLHIRVRPGYFPFVEPGVEIDCSCPFCNDGCSTCKYTRWIELLGAGLVHPNVLHCGGIDPSVYSGFAFGMGLERLAMIKYGINDIRLFHRNALSFLKQF